MRGGTPGFAQAVLALAGRDLLVRPATGGWWQVCDLSGRQPPRTLTAAEVVAEARRRGLLAETPPRESVQAGPGRQLALPI